MRNSWSGIIALTACIGIASCGGSVGSGGKSNANPLVVSLKASPVTAWLNAPVTFTVTCDSASQNKDGTPNNTGLSYTWTFGDGATATTTVPTVVHSYTEPASSVTYGVKCQDNNSGGLYSTLSSNPTYDAANPSSAIEVQNYYLNSVASDVCSSGKQGIGWCWQTPTPTGATLSAIATPTQSSSSAQSSLVAWAVGSSGSIIRTADGGTTWSAQSSGTAQALSAISAVDQSTAWVVGAAGTVLVTANAGATWNAQTTWPNRNNLTSVAALSSSVAWACDQSGIYKTANGGSSWTLQQGNLACLSVSAVDVNNVWAVASGGEVWNTTNGGTSWTMVLSRVPSSGFSSVAAVTSTKAWVVGQGTIQEIQITNGQASPTEYATTDGSFTAVSVSPGDTTSAWILDSANNIVYRAVEGTVPATLVPGDVPTGLLALSEVDINDDPTTNSVTSHTVWGVGIGGTIARSTDSASTWDSLQTNGPAISQIAAIDDNTVWANSSNGVLHSTNGGNSWVSSTLSATGSYGGEYFSSINVQSLSATGTQSAWVSAETTTSNGLSVTLFQTNDGGVDWTSVKSFNITTCSASSYVANFGTTIWDFIGTKDCSLPRGLGQVNYDLMANFDGGASSTWTDISPAAPYAPLSGITAVSVAQSDGSLWVSGFSGIAFLDYTSGIVWQCTGCNSTSPKWSDSYPQGQAFSQATSSEMTAISALSASIAWAASGSTLYLTTDGGVKWTPEPLPNANVTIDAIQVVDGATVLVAAQGTENYQNYLWRGTLAGGSTTWTWTAENDFGVSVSSISALSDNAISLGGSTGAILKTETGGQ